ncbi:beta-ketoacyl synthase chain length factor [Sphaerotilus sp.]|uniref:beta-ketoacyl synthase chain length factor n=1 Tax=Sphaerotilus sp. TaxID=2093942 RepID=UPI00286DAFB5|nr:beta-ketoacyl synthase chain length factor [Sphaerotilus sp.]
MAVATLSVVVQGVGLVGPGLVSWSAAQAVLQGHAAYAPAASVVPPSQRLPAAERRRAGTAIKTAMSVADAACADAGVDPQTLGSVFTSSSGDGANCHTLCETLASPNPADRLVSPTRFTNSVHNAPAGYWHIAVGSRAASTSLCAFDASFGAGLIAALTQVHAASAPLLLVASDTPYPEPLHTLRRLPDTLGVALVLAPVPAPGLPPATGATLRVVLCPADQAPPETPCREAALETLRQQIPAARALPLLEALARGEAATVVIAAAAPLVLVIEVVPA